MTTTPPPPPTAPPPGSLRLAPGVRIDEGRLSFSTSRSSGPGGQNVNKRDTKVELRLEIGDLPMPPDARARLARLLGTRLSEDGTIRIVCDETRSQKNNRQRAIARLAEFVVRAMRKPVRRVKTKPTRSSVRRRLDEKTKQGKRKQERARNKGRTRDE